LLFRKAAMAVESAAVMVSPSPLTNHVILLQERPHWPVDRLGSIVISEHPLTVDVAARVTTGITGFAGDSNLTDCCGENLHFLELMQIGFVLLVARVILSPTIGSAVILDDEIIVTTTCLVDVQMHGALESP
jgi:hypothetical protein